ncbi:hypothetical protein AKJ64_03765 [candidate division MSBL1 archaeon SCGC-AAA259E17]|uniref:Uncharacterized protein n=1 Tax=candidate division MSBL1 archaeon SCGC-AAA259E17 TaxID=1698263 RepID=A0A133UDC4_9EURY|nr:hypothetical protein AKJ64_03765 [candidate division MSBL1 archaeon SCGC-AAA259E17]
MNELAKRVSGGLVKYYVENLSVTLTNKGSFPIQVDQLEIIVDGKEGASDQFFGGKRKIMPGQTRTLVGDFWEEIGAGIHTVTYRLVDTHEKAPDFILKVRKKTIKIGPYSGENLGKTKILGITELEGRHSEFGYYLDGVTFGLNYEGDAPTYIDAHVVVENEKGSTYSIRIPRKGVQSIHATPLGAWGPLEKGIHPVKIELIRETEWEENKIASYSTQIHIPPKS